MSDSVDNTSSALITQAVPDDRSSASNTQAELVMTEYGEGLAPTSSVAVANSIASVVEAAPQIAEFFREQFRALNVVRTSIALEATLDQRLCARKLNQILVDILRFETGCTSIEDGMGFLLHATYGSSSHLRIFSEAYHLTQLVMSNNSPWREFMLHSICDDIEEILHWYARRKLSLVLLEEEGALHTEDERIFALRVLHERTVAGELGFEVVAAARLMQRANMALWFKVLAGNADLHQHSWTNQSCMGFSEINRKQPIASVVSFIPDQQRMIIDELRCFIPYAALERRAGAHQLELRVLISDGYFRDLVSTKISTSYVNSWQPSIKELVPAPHTHGLWQKDVVSGSELLNANYSLHPHVDSDMATLQVSFDLRLIGLEDQTVTCKLSIYDAEMFSIETEDTDLGSSLSLTIERSALRFNALILSKLLASAQILQAKFYELVVSGSQRRVICGTIGRL